MVNSLKTSLMRRWSPYDLFLVAILAGAAIPRTLRLTGSLWYDETFASRLKLTFSLPGLAWIFYDTHPPLYNFLMLLWNHVFGDSELSLRSLPFLCSLAAIVVTAGIARDIAGERVALVAALMMALSGASVYYAQEARSYSLIILLFVLMAKYLLRYARTADPKDLRRVVFLSFLCSLSHIYAMIFVLCLTATLTWRVAQRQNIIAIMRLALLQVVLAVPFYFSILLIRFFTSEQVYPPGTERFSWAQTMGLLPFCLFGYSAFKLYWLAEVVALGLFVIGLGILLRRVRQEAAQSEGHGPLRHTFTFPGVNRLFIGVATVGIVAFGGIALLPCVARPDLFSNLFRSPDHHLLMGQMVSLLSRTGTLYVIGYGCALVVWLLLGTRAVSTRLMSHFTERSALHADLARWIDTIVLFPVLGLVSVAVISHLSRSYNIRYVLPLLPFLLLPMAVAVATISVTRIRFVALVLVGLAQAYALAQQGPVYDDRKPDYRAAVRYLYDTGGSHYPVAATASWEALNVGRYYSRRFGQPELQLVPVAAVPALSKVSVLVAQQFPLTEDRFRDLRHALMNNSEVKAVQFPGVTLYEVDRHSSR
jgi:4-amino-4-deoxy-L-arabinose transferase-like glycosyltransferase